MMKIQAQNLRAIASVIENHECRQWLIVITRARQHWQRLTPDFYIGEYMCRDGSTMILIDKRLSEGLQGMRDYLRRPILIISAFRTPEHNAAVGGAEHSEHMTGKAADIHITGMTGQQIADTARRFGFTGIGIASTWAHVDVRDTPAEWRY